MDLIPKIRPGEGLSIEKLNAVIDKVNAIETSKKELEQLKDSLRVDIEKNNSILEGIKNSQSSLQQIASSNGLNLLIDIINNQIKKDASIVKNCTQSFSMEELQDGTGTIITLETKDEDGNTINETSFTLQHGSQGEPGEPGLQGEPGPRGYRGLPGPRGYRGLTGEQGSSVTIESEYTLNSLDGTTPSDASNYLKIKVNNLNPDGTEKDSKTYYIPTKGYIYVPNIVTTEENGIKQSILTFEKQLASSVLAPTILDRSYNITGATGPRGPQGLQGVPGTGLTCSNLIKISDTDILIGDIVDGPNDDSGNPTKISLEEYLSKSTITPEQQNAAINAIIISKNPSTTKTFGLLPIDNINPATGTITGRKFTFVEKSEDDTWQLMRGTQFQQNNGTDIIDVSDLITNTYENNITQQFNGINKLKIGTGFLHIPEQESEFITYLYTVYDILRLKDSNNVADTSFYSLVKSKLNGGVNLKDSEIDTITANNIILPLTYDNENPSKGSIIARVLKTSNFAYTPETISEDIAWGDVYWSMDIPISGIYYFQTYLTSWGPERGLYLGESILLDTKEIKSILLNESWRNACTVTTVSRYAIIKAEIHPEDQTKLRVTITICAGEDNTAFVRIKKLFNDAEI